jgi:hypothetical protein
MNLRDADIEMSILRCDIEFRRKRRGVLKIKEEYQPIRYNYNIKRY